ncbi:MAG: hypothetical protein KA521_11480 [Crocinitomicaceae bacterium]|nr:hypothetical protein [Crocinitomicaceae bacterium]
MIRIILILFFCLFTTQITLGSESSILLQKGWAELVKDHDADAFKYFGQAYEQAQLENNVENSAMALLNMGICSYGSSLTHGLHYCMRALEEFKQLEKSEPEKAFIGRSKCLQLMSTINGRQGKYRESIALSMEAMNGFPSANDTTGYLGLIYSSMGEAYLRLGLADSSEYFHRLALEERLLTQNFTYLPGSYLSVASIELGKGNQEQSHMYYSRALFIADSTGNRQAQVSSLLGLGRWTLTFEKNDKKAEEYYLNAKQIGAELTDKSFYLKTLLQLQELKKQQGNFKEALTYGEEIQSLKDQLATWEKDRITKSLEIQFDVSEKDRQLSIIQNEKRIALLTNYLLWGTIGFLILIGAGIIFFYRRTNKRDKLLLKTKEELMSALEEQKKLKEQQLHNELEFKESQISAVTFQMLQKNELLRELKERLDQENGTSNDHPLHKIINKGLSHDKEWAHFNTSFESINKNFYARLKQAYPDISPNDLKISALIKMGLSIKEMADILNISADSVKTARYRLRKKLQLNTEDNLTDFILNLQ